jgi:polyisoprenoid-binding protein YceI
VEDEPSVLRDRRPMPAALAGYNASRAPAVGTYAIHPQHTDVRFAMRHRLGLGTVSGTVNVRAAELVIGDQLRTTTLTAILDAGSISTGSAKRDRKIHSARLLDTAIYPEIYFACDLIHERAGKLVATGSVTAHGVSARTEVTLDQLNDTFEGALALHASAKIDRYAHDVTAARGLAGRWVHLSITALAAR